MTVCLIGWRRWWGDGVQARVPFRLYLKGEMKMDSNLTAVVKKKVGRRRLVVGRDIAWLPP